MNKTITTILVLAIIIIGGYFLVSNREVQAPTQDLQQTTDTESENKMSDENTPAGQESMSQNVITYTNAGYSPNTLTIKLGETVTWKNESPSGMWTASAMHPSHIVYAGTSLQEHCPDTAGESFDACTSTQPGDSWSFTFNKKGTWKYHNHVNASHFGTIIVE